MKIHKKILLHYQSCDSPVDKEGYLYKKGVRNSSYQKRWFVLKGNLLFYKERRSERELLGVLVLEGCSVQLCESDERFAFSVVWSESHVAGGRVYKLAAEDQSTQESWLKALLSANHAYLQLLLMDLETRYRELGGMSHPVPLKPAPYAPPGPTASSCTAKQLLPAPSHPPQCSNQEVSETVAKEKCKCGAHIWACPASEGVARVWVGTPGGIY
ncbi:unnamed protein product [Boreogadus saida]